jgi:prepilin-type N-terminal cleavage/methylation domain-containing protein
MDVLKTQSLAGFTLIELVVVISIIGILANYAVQKLPSAPDMNTPPQAKQLVSDLRYTQALSMTTNQRYYLKITGSTYQIINAVTASPILLPLNGTTATLGAGITFGALTALPNNLVEFNGFGVPYITSTATGGTPLASQASIPLTGGGTTITVIITAETGKVIAQ